jgi:hypothetical protein
VALVSVGPYLVYIHRYIKYRLLLSKRKMKTGLGKDELEVFIITSWTILFGERGGGDVT